MSAEDEELHVDREVSRAQRDAAGWANAIVISSDEDEAPALAVAHKKTPSAGASSSTAAGKRPASSREQDVKPDVKHLKANSGRQLQPPASAASGGPFAPSGAVAAAANDLEGLSFSDPVKFAQGQSADSPRRAGHVMVQLSAARSRDTGDAPVILGTGAEQSSLSRLLCLAHSADVTVQDGTPGNQTLAALRKLADPSNTAKRVATATS